MGLGKSLHLYGQKRNNKSRPVPEKWDITLQKTAEESTKQMYRTLQTEQIERMERIFDIDDGRLY